MSAYKEIKYNQRKEAKITDFDETGRELNFDALIEEEHAGEIQLTENPVEFGANINDHAIIMPVTLRIVGRITDHPTRFFFNDALDGSVTQVNSTRSIDAWTILNSIKDARQPVTIVTHLKEYVDMVMIRLKTTQNAQNAYTLDFEAEFKEVITVSEPFTQTASFEAGIVENEATPTMSVGEAAAIEAKVVETENRLTLQSGGYNQNPSFWGGGGNNTTFSATGTLP